MKKNKKLIKSMPSCLLLLSAIVSSLGMYLIYFDSTALTWPAIDNLPAIYRLLDKNCLINDFFTNASATNNPRLPYVYLLKALNDIFRTEVGGGLAIMKALHLSLLPIAITTLIWAAMQAVQGRALNEQYPEKKLLFLLTCVSSPIIIFLLQGKFGISLSIGWWSPLIFDAISHNLSILLTLLGFSLIFYRQLLVGACFVFVSGIIHPSMCIFTSIFSYVLLSRPFQLKYNKNLIKFGFSSLFLALLLVMFLFSQGNFLSSEEFIRIFIVEAHPSHYLPSQFGTHSSLHWSVSFSTVTLSLIAISIALYALNCTAWQNSFAAVCVYVGSVIVQYIGIEVWPVKTIAVLGPCRFTSFGPWFLIIFFLVLLGKAVSQSWHARKYADHLYSACTERLRIIHLFLSGLILAATSVIYASKAGKFDFIKKEDLRLFEWVEKHSGRNDVFIMPFSETRIFLPLKTMRAVFFGNGFPYSESYFREYEARKILVSGSSDIINGIRGDWIGEKYAKFYRSLTPDDFIKISTQYQADWVIVEKDYSEAFLNCPSAFSSKLYKVFHIKNLKRCISKKRETPDGARVKNFV